jgi:hypothetical protein
MVKSNAVEGREDEYNSWYNNVHLAEVLKIKGFLSAQRFIINEIQIQNEQVHGYLAIYEIESADVSETIDSLRQASWLNRSDAIDARSTEISIFSAITQIQNASD